MRRFFVTAVVAFAPLARAQDASVPPPPPTPVSSSAATMTSPPAAATQSTTPAPEEAKKPVRPATGYGWSRPSAGAAPPRSRSKFVARPKKDLTEVWQPGFEAKPDVGSTFFVTMSRKSEVEEKKSEGGLVYVIKNSRVALWNNRNPLVTEFFATPVSSARLVQSKDDVLLVLDLKHASSGTLTFQPIGDLVQLRVSFGPEKPSGSSPAGSNTPDRN